jgi:hypothetical protein
MLLAQIEYLLEELRVLRAQIPGKIKFTAADRRVLAEKAMAMSRKVMEVTESVVTPDTLLQWQRDLIRKKWDTSPNRARQDGRASRSMWKSW